MIQLIKIFKIHAGKVDFFETHEARGISSYIAGRFRESYPEGSSALVSMMEEVDRKLTYDEGGELILTDDKAPVELLGMQVIDEMISDELEYYKELFEGLSFSEMLDMLK